SAMASRAASAVLDMFRPMCCSFRGRSVLPGRRWRSLDEPSLSGESPPAVEDAPLGGVEPAPDADAFVVVERVGEAVPADRAAGADGLGGRTGPGVADVGEEEVGESPAGGVPDPVHVVDESGHHSRCLRSRWMSGISPTAAWIWWTRWSWSARASAQSRVSTRIWSRRGRAGTLVVVTHQAPADGRVVVTRQVPTGVGITSSRSSS